MGMCNEGFILTGVKAGSRAYIHKDPGGEAFSFSKKFGESDYGKEGAFNSRRKN